MPKKIILILLFFCVGSLLCVLLGQVPRSEEIKRVNYIQLQGNKIIRTDSVVLQINDRMGDNDARISFQYSKGQGEKLTIGDAWIEDLSGKIVRKLKKGDIKEQSVFSDMFFYSDYFLKWFELRHNVYPYRIVYSTKRVQDKYLSIMQFTNLGIGQPLRNRKVVLEIPLDKDIKYIQKNMDAPSIELLSKSKKYIWEYSYQGEKKQKFASINTTNAPSMSIVPVQFKYGVEGSHNSWSDFGNWIYRLNANKNILPQSEKDKVNTLLFDVSDRREKIDILYKYLQEYTRYANVSIDLGGLQTYPAEYVCKNRYGDCKALSNYMQSLLKYVGIESYYTLVHSDDKIIDIDEDFASQAFNHVILTIPNVEDTIYLECTSKYTPLGYIHTAIQGRKALLVKESGSHLVSIPSMNEQDVLCSRQFDVKLEESNAAQIGLISTERGLAYESYSSLVNNWNKHNIDTYIKEYVFGGSYQLLDYKFEKSTGNEVSISLETNLRMENMHKMYGNNLVLYPFLFYVPILESPSVRTQDIQIDYPIHRKDTVTYDIGNRVVKKMPDGVIVTSPFGDKYTTQFENRGNILVVSKTYLVTAKRLSVEEYVDFYYFIDKVRSLENKNIYLEIE